MAEEYIIYIVYIIYTKKVYPFQMWRKVIIMTQILWEKKNLYRKSVWALEQAAKEVVE